MFIQGNTSIRELRVVTLSCKSILVLFWSECTTFTCDLAQKAPISVQNGTMLQHMAFFLRPSWYWWSCMPSHVPLCPTPMWCRHDGLPCNGSQWMPTTRSLPPSKRCNGYWWNWMYSHVPHCPMWQRHDTMSRSVWQWLSNASYLHANKRWDRI